MAEIKDNISIDATMTIAGFVGALVSLKYAKNTSTLGSALSIIGGGFLAVFATPAVVEWFRFLGSESATTFTSFVIGLFGLNLVAWLFTYIETNGWQGVIETLARRRGSGK